MNKMKPERVVEILAKHGQNVTVEQAAKILDWLRNLADIAVAQYLRGDQNKSETTDMVKPKKKK